MTFLLPPDDGLVLQVSTDLLGLIERWLPTVRHSGGGDPESNAGADSDGGFGRIRISMESSAPDAPDAPDAADASDTSDSLDAEPTLRLGTVRAWSLDRGLWLHAAEGRLSGHVGTDGTAHLNVSEPTDGVAAALPDALTIASACLLTARGHALIHAGGVLGTIDREVGGGGSGAEPEAAWLVAGDGRAGKTSTIAALVEAGHDWLSDDQLVISSGGGDDPPVAHGWPRTVHLDSGWEAGRPTGERLDRAPEDLGPGRLVGRAPIRGVLLPEIRPNAETRLETAHPTEALAALLRQSPWLMAMPQSASGILGQLERVAVLPCHRLVLGRDAFGNGRLLSSLLRDAGRAAGR